MKATLVFNLDDEEDKVNHQHALNGSKYHSVLWELIHQYIRGKVKYVSEDTHEEYVKALTELREHLLNELREYGVDQEL